MAMSVKRIDPASLNLKEQVVSINRVTKVVKGGKNLSFSALVVIGDPGAKVRLTQPTRRAKEELYGLEIAHDIQETPERTRPPGEAARQSCAAGPTQAGEGFSGSWGGWFVGRRPRPGRRFGGGCRRRFGAGRAIQRKRTAFSE